MRAQVSLERARPRVRLATDPTQVRLLRRSALSQPSAATHRRSTGETTVVGPRPEAERRHGARPTAQRRQPAGAAASAVARDRHRPAGRLVLMLVLMVMMMMMTLDVGRRRQHSGAAAAAG